MLAGLVLPVAMWSQAGAGDHKGIGDNGPVQLVAQTESQLSATIDDFHNLGVKWVRLDFDWSDIEPRPGEFRLIGYDAVVKRLTGAGISILGVIDYTPMWANGDKPTKFYPPTNVADYGKFAGYLASRYAHFGVHAWEIWNEPNIGQFWGPAPDPGVFSALLQAAYTAIHAADSKAIVITGGLAQPRNGPTTISALDFVRAIYAKGARPYFDAVADHPYNSPRMPSDSASSNNWQKMYATVPSFRSIMSANGDMEKKIWITEYGAPTAGISPYSQKIVITEDQQANMVSEAYSLVRTYSWAGPLFWYEYQDLCAEAANESSECYYGLVRYDGTRKPSYDRYREALD